MLIKCPECGHQVSDKAPLCPNCGVEISGNINRNAQEGNTQEGGCDNRNVQKNTETSVDNPVIVTPVEEEVIAKPIIGSDYENEFAEDKSGTRQRSTSHGTIVVSLLIAAIICGIGLYFYKDAVDRNKAETTPADEISTVSDTAEAAIEVIPLEEKDTVKEAEPVVKEEELKEPEEAEEEKETIPEITSAEKAKAKESVSKFLRALNSHNKEALLASTTTTMTSLNGKNNASKNDILKYMIDSYQADVKSLTWSIDDVADVTKDHSADGIPEYKITLKATKETEREGGTSKHKFNIKATVAADGKLSAINIARD